MFCIPAFFPRNSAFGIPELARLNRLEFVLFEIYRMNLARIRLDIRVFGQNRSKIQDLLGIRLLDYQNVEVKVVDHFRNFFSADRPSVPCERIFFACIADVPRCKSDTFCQSRLDES